MASRGAGDGDGDGSGAGAAPGLARTVGENGPCISIGVTMFWTARSMSAYDSWPPPRPDRCEIGESAISSRRDLNRSLRNAFSVRLSWCSACWVNASFALTLSFSAATAAARASSAAPFASESCRFISLNFFLADCWCSILPRCSSSLDCSTLECFSASSRIFSCILAS